VLSCAPAAAAGGDEAAGADSASGGDLAQASQIAPAPTMDITDRAGRMGV
jgi:hypothetical protein